MQIRIDIPAGIECRGRNGWFNGDHAYATRIYDGNVHVEIFSNRAVQNCAPILISGPIQQVQATLQELLDAVTKMAGTSAPAPVAAAVV